MEEADIFVGLIGNYRGWEPDGDNKQRSITEMEYDWAVDAKKPRLMFVAPEEFRRRRPAHRWRGGRAPAPVPRPRSWAETAGLALLRLRARSLHRRLQGPVQRASSTIWPPKRRPRPAVRAGKLDAAAMARAAIAEVAAEENLTFDEMQGQIRPGRNRSHHGRRRGCRGPDRAV